jgi:hypothetical protein
MEASEGSSSPKKGENKDSIYFQFKEVCDGENGEIMLGTGDEVEFDLIDMAPSGEAKQKAINIVRVKGAGRRPLALNSKLKKGLGKNSPMVMSRMAKVS